MEGIAMLAVLIAFVLFGVHFSVALWATALLFGLYLRGTRILGVFMTGFWGIMTNEVMIAVPLFVLMGCLLQKTGLAERMFDNLYVLLGPLKGGLAVATNLIATVFAACTGVIAASVTTMGLMSFPSMFKRGYSPELATGTVCAGGSLGILIPPSVMLVLLGPMTGVSVARLFAAAIIPGIILSIFYVSYILIYSYYNPDSAPAIPKDEVGEFSWLNVLKLLKNILPVVLLLGAVLGSIFFGIASPTEASAVSVLGATLIALAYREFNLRNLYDSVRETIKVTSMVFYLIAGASFFTSVFLFAGGGRTIQDFFLGLPFGPYGILLVMMALVFFLGFFICWTGIIFIVAPLLVPVAIRLGFDPLWFVMLIAINLQMSFLTPPFAYSIFFVKNVAPPQVTTNQIYRGVIPFVALQIIGLAFVIYFEPLIMWLPKILFG